MDRSQDPENIQDKVAILGRSNVIDQPPYHLHESPLTVVEANTAFGGAAASDPRTPGTESLQTVLDEEPEIKIANSPTTGEEEDGASSELVVPSTHWIGKDLEGLTTTTLAGVARNKRSKSKVDQSVHPPADAGYHAADQDLSRPV
jgi:hypothetical protein